MKSIISDSAVSEVVGYTIILGLTIIGVAMITLVGMPAIFHLQDTANIRNAEQTFTVLDSRASNALLGDSPQQVINTNLGGGILLVEPNRTNSTSYVNIKSNTFNLNLPMGQIKYSLGERIVAYEGGGIWSKYPNGSVMLSPPEFHYDGRTLTLPIININGSGMIGGKGTAAISLNRKSTMVLFPNTSLDTNRTNPLNYSLSGKVYVNITSDFYDAWADYAKGLLYTQVIKDPTKRTASIELRVVPTTLGGWTEYTNTINLRGLPDNDKPLGNFSFKIKDSNFNNFNWQLTANSGTKTLIFEIKKGTDLSIGYRDTAYSPNAEIWDKSGAYTVSGGYAVADLLDKNILLTYSGVQVGTNTPCANKMNPSDLHVPDFSWNDRTINAGNTESLYNITQHYILLMSQSTGEASFSGCSPAGKHGPESGSEMLIDYDAVGAITFLHITNNAADVRIS